MDIRILFYCCGGWSLVHICRLQKQNLSIVMSWKHCCGNETLWLPSCNLQSSNSSPLWPSIPLFLANHIRIILICLIEPKGTWVVSWKLVAPACDDRMRYCFSCRQEAAFEALMVSCDKLQDEKARLEKVHFFQ
jgi:hypothetical protein